MSQSDTQHPTGYVAHLPKLWHPGCDNERTYQALRVLLAALRERVHRGMCRRRQVAASGRRGNQHQGHGRLGDARSDTDWSRRPDRGRQRGRRRCGGGFCPGRDVAGGGQHRRWRIHDGCPNGWRGRVHRLPRDSPRGRYERHVRRQPEPIPSPSRRHARHGPWALPGPRDVWPPALVAAR